MNRAQGSARPPPPPAPRLLPLALPLVAEMALGIGMGVVGTMGTTALATHAYTMQVIHMILLFAITLGLSAEIMVGHLVGAGRLHDAHRLVRRLLGRGLLMAAGVSLIAALLRRWLMAGSPPMRRSSRRASRCCGSPSRWRPAAPSTWCWSTRCGPPAMRVIR